MVETSRQIIAFLKGRDVLCPACRYNMRDLNRIICPECGYELTIDDCYEKTSINAFLGLFISGSMGLGYSLSLIAGIIMQGGISSVYQDIAGLTILFVLIVSTCEMLFCQLLKENIRQLGFGFQNRLFFGAMTAKSLLILLSLSFMT